MKACPSWAGMPEGSTTAWVDVVFPFSVVKAGYYNASIHFRWGIQDALRLTGSSSCGKPVNYSKGYNYVDCVQGAQWSVFMSAEIWDLTNRSMVSHSISEWAVSNSSYSDVYSYCKHGACSSGTYSAGCNFNAKGQGPGHDVLGLCEAPGAHSGASSLWSNTTDYPMNYNGYNTTLLTGHKYAIVMLVQFMSTSFDYGGNVGFTGTNYFSNYFNPPGVSGAAAVRALPAIGGITVTSVSVAKVV